MAVFTINITKVGDGSSASVDLNKFLGALEGCDPVNDVLSIDGIQYVLSSAELGGSGSSVWGSLTGDLADQTDLSIALSNKADLVAGVVPSYQLPSYVDDVIIVDNTGDLALPGEEGKLYIAKDSNHQYRWSDALPGYVDITGGDIGNGNVDYIPVIKTVNGIKILTFQNSWRSQDADYSISSKPSKSPRVIAGTDIDGNYKLVVDGISLFAGNLNLQDIINRKIEWGTGGASIEQEGIDNERSLLFAKATTHRFTDNNDNEKFKTILGGAYQEGEKLGTENWVINNFQAKPIQLTYSEAQELALSNSIVQGQQYWITDAASSVTNMGVVVIGSPTPNKFLTSAIGGFLNADFFLVGDYDLIESVTGFPLAELYGVWFRLDETDYPFVNGGIVIWNFEMYQVIDQYAFNGSEPDTNPTAYRKFAKVDYKNERVGYIQKWDPVEYVFETDTILYRQDEFGSVINNSSLNTFQFGQGSVWQQNGANCYISNKNCYQSISGTQRGGATMYANANRGSLINITHDSGTINPVLCAYGYLVNCLFDSKNNSYNIGGNNEVNDGFQQFVGCSLTEESSTFSIFLDVSGLSTIPFVAGFIGVIYLISSNGSEVIDRLDFSNYVIPVTFKRNSETDFQFTNTTSFIFKSGVSTMKINSYEGFLTVLRNGTTNRVCEINSAEY